MSTSLKVDRSTFFYIILTYIPKHYHSMYIWEVICTLRYEWTLSKWIKFRLTQSLPLLSTFCENFPSRAQGSYFLVFECMTVLLSVALCVGFIYMPNHRSSFWVLSFIDLKSIMFLKDVDCLVVNLEYVSCTWNKSGTPEVNYTFYSKCVIVDNSTNKSL